MSEAYQQFSAVALYGNPPACDGLPMDSLSRRALLMSGVSLSIASAALPKAGPEQVYLFATDEYEIRITLAFYDCYKGGLQFQAQLPDRNFCLSPRGEENRSCANDFKGSLAVVRYQLSARGRLAHSPSLREYVRNIDQSEQVPARPPFERVIATKYGLASDIQAFGYQKTAAEQTAAAAAPDDAWCLFRQDLYLQDPSLQDKAGPFLVVHWKHTLTGIRVLDMIPQNGTTRLSEGHR